MVDAIEHLFSGKFMPHGHCYLWLPEILWTNVISDALIAIAYFSIPATIAVVVKKRTDVDFGAVPWLFSAFIFLCGATHVIGVINVWNGYYGIQGMFKAATAIASILTAYAIWRLLPTALMIPSNEQLTAKVEDATTELQSRNELLVEANREIASFVSAASHDLKEPLRTLVNFSELLEQDVGDDLTDDARTDLRHIREGATLMQSLVNDLLDYARTGRTELNLKEVNLDDCVDDALRSIGMLVNERDIEIIREKLPSTIGDPVLLRQVFTNLLTNAIKFSPSEHGSRIEVTCEIDRDGRSVIGVRDFGLGIDASFHEQIFEPFARLNARDEYEGTGIGLAIARRAVERHHGRIWVESKLGEGSHFRFYLDADIATSTNLRVPPIFD